MRFAPAIALVAVVAGIASAPAPVHAAGCTDVLRTFYVKSASLDETITAHWNYDDGAGNKAVLDTTQTGALRLASGKAPSRADWRKGHQYGWFDELQGKCRIPNYAGVHVQGGRQRGESRHAPAE